jgi:hypothetical protein
MCSAAVDGLHERDQPAKRGLTQVEYKRTLVRAARRIGANATVVCGVTLGQYAFVGAGAVVTKDVKPFALVTGVPLAKLDGCAFVASACRRRPAESRERERGPECPHRVPCVSAVFTLDDDNLRLAEAP